MIVYTVNIDGYDSPNPVLEKREGYKYIYITNTNIEPRGWEIKKVDKFTDAGRSSRYYKINGCRESKRIFKSIKIKKES